jgi:hypothetical protein
VEGRLFKTKQSMIKLSTIRPNPANPRTIKDAAFEKLCKSIQTDPEFMELRPIITDADNMVLGGNQRLKALKHLGYTEVPETWIRAAETLSDDQKRRFIVLDNNSSGEWSLEELAANWSKEELEEWGVEVEWGVGIEVGTDGFTLPDGDKAPFQQMTFTLADEQAEQIKNAIADIKQTEEYKYAETMGNENSNGNALYLIVMQWAGQRT